MAELESDAREGAREREREREQHQGCTYGEHADVDGDQGGEVREQESRLLARDDLSLQHRLHKYLDIRCIDSRMGGKHPRGE